MVHKVGREPGRQVGKWVGGQLARVGRLRCLAGGCATGAAVEARAPINVLRRRAGGETGAPVRRGTPGGLYPFNINNSPRLRPGCPPTKLWQGYRFLIGGGTRGAPEALGTQLLL